MARRIVRETGFRLPTPVASAMRGELDRVAQTVIESVISEVPSYSEPFRGRMGRNIETAVGLALNGFLDAASDSGDSSTRIETSSTPPTTWAAARLGAGGRWMRSPPPTGSVPAGRGAT